MDRKTIVIKKYENRRLYDTTNSRYVNLDEVAQAIQEGVDVQVVDAATGEDITRVILTQIIMEDAKGPNSAFPLDVLRQMVIASGRASQEGALKYMKAIFEMYQNAYRAFTPPMSPLDLMRNIPGTPRTTTPAPAPTNVPEPHAPEAKPEDPAREAETRDLRRRVEELESLVAKLGAEKPARKHKKSGRRQ
ncbi:MAG: polyhydroxyalkanoate synthesis regulator DNA-binding domain-containing protein [Terriglobales bacterium]